jgi:hypothetical protein
LAAGGLLGREQWRRGRQMGSREHRRSLRGVFTLFIREVEIQLILIKDPIVRAIFNHNHIQMFGARSSSRC